MYIYIPYVFFPCNKISIKISVFGNKISIKSTCLRQIKIIILSIQVYLKKFCWRQQLYVCSAVFNIYQGFLSSNHTKTHVLNRILLWEFLKRIFAYHNGRMSSTGKKNIDDISLKKKKTLKDQSKYMFGLPTLYFTKTEIWISHRHRTLLSLFTFISNLSRCCVIVHFNLMKQLSAFL